MYLTNDSVSEDEDTDDINHNDDNDNQDYNDDIKLRERFSNAGRKILS